MATGPKEHCLPNNCSQIISMMSTTNVTRFVEKVPCSVCDEAGQIKSPDPEQCKECEQRGWVEDSSGEPQICVACNGERETWPMLNCADCEEGMIITVLTRPVTD